VRWFVLCLLGLCAVSCGEEPLEFVCETDKQCDAEGDGLCADPWCSYPDEGCDSGYRYSTDAEPAVAEMCVSASDLRRE
jgi:hypothetical protein